MKPWEMLFSFIESAFTLLVNGLGQIITGVVNQLGTTTWILFIPLVLSLFGIVYGMIIRLIHMSGR